MFEFVGFDSLVNRHAALTLTHFLWQGLAIAILAAVVARRLRRRSSQHRYGVYLAALASMVACLPATFLLVSNRDSETVASVGVDPNTERPGRVEFNELVAAGVSKEMSARTLATESRGAETAISHQDVQRLLAWQSISPYVMFLYSIGVAVMLLRLAISLHGGYRLRRNTTSIDSELVAVASSAANRIGLSHLPAIALCEHVSGPVVLGVLRPMILLPVAFTTGLTPQQIDAILTHELAHVRRHDHLVLLAQRLVESLLFFHPAVWYVSRCLTVERENCCDDAVVESGSPRQAYAELLLQIAEQRVLGALAPTALAASGSNTSRLRNRVIRLLHAPQEPVVRLGRTAATLMACLPLAVIVLPVVALVWEQPTLRASTSWRAQGLPAESAADTQPEQQSTPQPKQEAKPVNLVTIRDQVRKELAQQESREAIEKAAGDLETRFSQRRQLAVVRAAVASRLSEIGRHDSVIVWAQAALQGPLVPADRVTMFAAWSESSHAQYVGKYTLEANLHRVVPLILALLESQRSKMVEQRDGFAIKMTRLIAGDRIGGDVETYFQRFPQAGFFLDEQQNPPRPAWLPADIAFYDSVLIDLPQLFESLPPLVNAVAGDSIFEDVVESLLRDPNGPQFDVRHDLIAHLGNRVTVIADYSPPPIRRHRMMLAFASVDSTKLAATLDKAFSIDPQARRRQQGEHVVWEIVGHDGKVTHAVSMAHNQWLVTHDVQLLDKVISSEPKGNTNDR